MYAIEKKFTFEAAHFLAGLSENHPCSCMHGHSYHGSIRIESEVLDTNGFVLDFGELKRFVTSFIMKNMDHKIIICDRQKEAFESIDSNNIYYVMPEKYTNTTAENMCHLISEKLMKFLKKHKTIYPDVVTVKLWETDNNMAEYRQELG